MKKRTMTINARLALVDYTLQALNLDPNRLHVKPEAQQIVIDNYEEIRGYLY